jgi:hypothetical protein
MDWRHALFERTHPATLLARTPKTADGIEQGEIE